VIAGDQEEAGWMEERTNDPWAGEESRESGGEPRRETYRLSGENLLTKVKELIHEGNVRRLTIKNEDDRTLIEIPLTVGVVGAVFLPVWAAIGAIAAIVTNCSIEVERNED
jgi:hypothetical protein